jgi:quercetin dioxygenase-like cupin family protein
VKIIKLPGAIVVALRRRVLNHIENNPPTRIIRAASEAHYLQRWELRNNNPNFDIYLHRFLKSDDTDALHDHPAVSLAILLSGSYKEWLGANRYKVRHPGDVILRAPATPHRIEIDESASAPVTLFIRGPKLREWGFHCASGWRHHSDFHTRGCDS